MPADNQYRIRAQSGINRLTPETELLTIDENVATGFVRDAVNTDMHTGGRRWTRRAGQNQIASTAIQGLWSHPALAVAMFVRKSDSQLYSIDIERTITARQSISAYRPISWHEFNGRGYFTNGAEIGYVNKAGVPGIIAKPNPPAPIVAASSAGGLWAGTYQVAYTAVYGGGIETGTHRISSVAVAQGGGITVGPVPAQSGITAYRIYRTEADDPVLRFAAEVAPSTGAVTLSQGTFLGEMLAPDLLHAQPLPAGDFIAAYNRRLFIASGSYLLFSSQHNIGYYVPHENWLPLPSAITMLAVSEDGLYIGCEDGSYWLGGSDPADFSLELVDNHGALIRRSQVYLPGDYRQQENVRDSGHLVPWWNTNGELLFGRPGGVVQRHGQQLALVPHTDSAMVWRRKEGHRQLISTLRGRKTSDDRQATGYSTVNTYTHGITLT